MAGWWPADGPRGEGLRRLLTCATTLDSRRVLAFPQLLGNTALHWAAANGRLEAVALLSSREGADVSGRNHGGGTPLHSAAAHARAAVAADLLEAGADPGATDENGDTPRDAASRRGYRSVEAILDRGPLAAEVRWAGGSGGGGGRRPEKPESEAAAKALGNAAFGQGSLSGARAAVGHYTDALLLRRAEMAGAVTGAETAEADVAAESVLLSNRSAAHAKLAQYHAALEDADAAVAIRPAWGKAHGRRGAALLGLDEPRKAEEAYADGLQHEPASAQLAEGLDEARARAVQQVEIG